MSCHRDLLPEPISKSNLASSDLFVVIPAKLVPAKAGSGNPVFLAFLDARFRGMTVYFALTNIQRKSTNGLHGSGS
jgi:hypothetical protein